MHLSPKLLIWWGGGWGVVNEINGKVTFPDMRVDLIVSTSGQSLLPSFSLDRPVYGYGSLYRNQWFQVQVR